MSFRDAKEAFRDAQISVDPKVEPVMYDIALGMRMLAEALETNLSEMRAALDQIEGRRH